jgi:hypothetical protein
MDKRKMDITTEKTDEGVIIHFNPEMFIFTGFYSFFVIEFICADAPIAYGI